MTLNVDVQSGKTSKEMIANFLLLLLIGVEPIRTSYAIVTNDENLIFIACDNARIL